MLSVIVIIAAVTVAIIVVVVGDSVFCLFSSTYTRVIITGTG